MEENWVEVYSETLKHEALVRITDEIEKNSDFVINKNNVRDYFDCDSFLDVLEELNIEYNIEMKRPSVWNEKGQHSYGEATLYVYVKESDEEKLTYSEPGFFELPEELKGVNLDEPEENDKNSIEYKIERFIDIFVNLILIIFIIVFIRMAIVLDDIQSRITFIVLVLISTIALIKLNKKKKTRRIE